MTHVILATFLPANEHGCVVTLYGAVEEAAIQTLRSQYPSVATRTHSTYCTAAKNGASRSTEGSGISVT